MAIGETVIDPCCERDGGNRKLNISVPKHIPILNNLSVMKEICGLRVLRLNRSFVENSNIEPRVFGDMMMEVFNHEKNGVLIHIIYSNDLTS